VVAKWNTKMQQWTFEFLYEKSIENTLVHGYEGQNYTCPERIAEVLTAGMPSGRREMRLAEMVITISHTTDNSVLAARLAEARQKPISPKEALAWPHVVCRRCPACLKANPAACTKCLECKAVFLGISDSVGTTTRTTTRRQKQGRTLLKSPGWKMMTFQYLRPTGQNTPISFRWSLRKHNTAPCHHWILA